MPKKPSPEALLAAAPAGESTYEYFCGVDWAEKTHDYAIVDRTGKRVASGHIPDSVAGLGTLLAALDGCAGRPMPVIIETERGLLVDELRRTQHPVYAVNPRAVKAYRERLSQSKAKSDKADALLMAHLGRTDLHLHRPLPAETADMLALNQLARAHQDSTWRVRKLANEIRSLLREYYPASLKAFPPDKLTSPLALTVLAAAPTPTEAARLTEEDLYQLAVAAGRQRGMAKEARRLHQIFTADEMRRLPAIEAAHGLTLRALIRALEGEVRAVTELESAVEQAVAALPLRKLQEAVPGLSPVLAARIVSEIGDDPGRFRDVASLKAYAGTVPITNASGSHRGVHFRHVKNNRLHGAAWQWGFMTLTHSAGARAYYDKHKKPGKHAAAVRRVANKLLGGLHHCLRTGEPWDELKIWGIVGRPERQPPEAAAEPDQPVAQESPVATAEPPRAERAEPTRLKPIPIREPAPVPGSGSPGQPHRELSVLRVGRV